MNILTTDFNTVIAVGSYLDNIYNLPVMLVIGIWYMYKMLGVSALIGLVITILYIPLSKIMFSRYQDVIMQQSAASDRRISSITEVLQGIKAIKLFGWETRFLKKVDDRREKQLAHSWKAFLWMSTISASSTLNPIIILVIMFAFHVGVFGNTLNAETAFASIAVFQIVRTAISHLPGFINFGVGGYVALKRIDLYLQQPQAQDLEKRCESVQTTSNELGFESADLEWNSAESSIDNVGNTSSTENNPNYKDVIELSREGLAIDDIAYVAQEAWLRNATIRENILFGEPYNRERYEEVLRVCALKPDLRILAAADMSEVGERGITLSGGQKQRHYYIKEAMNRISAHNRSFYGVWSTNMWLGMRVEAVSAVVASTTAIFILFNLNWIDAGMAGFILLYAMSFSDQMFWVIRDYSGNEMNMNAMERIMQYLNIDQEAALESGPENKPSAVWPKKGDLQIKDLASKGKIVLDGVDISKIGLEDLRRNVTVIPQDPVLFNGTIRFNLDPFDEHPDELLWEALRRTHLARDDASQASGVDGNDDFPGSERMAGIFASLDAEIRENGHNISAGQRQLVALARAMIRRSRLIIMDEATASVDFDADKRIQNTIRGPEFANSTLLCIAHRLRTIIDYDKVLVLDDGRVAEFDTPHNLLQNEGGIFRSMCEESGEYKAHVQRKGL
ncbi:hypothetical protein GGH99_000988 [Coemansia sp. RSA 1285]|nr:hypothetical protein GGH99_000988 [Coemansia sp. RSA 1285]